MIRTLLNYLWLCAVDFLSACRNPTGYIRKEAERDYREEKWNQTVEELKSWRVEESKRNNKHVIKSEFGEWEYWIDDDHYFHKTQIIRF